MRSSVRPCFVFVIAACGDPRSPTLVGSDAPPVAPGALVTVDTYGDSPVFIRYRLPGDQWRIPNDNGGNFEFLVDDEYELLAVCGTDQAGYQLGVTATTYDDSPSTYLPCFTPSDPVNAVEITGTMKQAGTVVVYGRDSSTTPNWSFDIFGAPGVHDLFAYDADRVLIRRDLEITGAQALADVDLVADGLPFQTRAFTVDSTPGETVRTSLLWSTQHTTLFLDVGTGTTAKLPDPSQLQTGDRQDVLLDAGTPTTSRSAYIRQEPDSPLDIALLPALEGITLTDSSATWTGTLPGADADLYAFAGTTDLYYQATRGWLANHHAITVDTAIDGFDPAWRLAAPDFVSFEATDGTDAVYRSTAVFSSPITKRAVISQRRHATRRHASWRLPR